MGTLNRSDLYGGMSGAVLTPDTISANGPNQSAVAPSSQVREVSGNGAAMSWIGFVLCLVALRLLIEYA